MTIRRGVLVLGVLGICAVAPSRVRGATATEVEGAGYVGEAPGSFTCGPSVRARYAGGAGRVRIAENDKRILGEGWSGEAAGTLARERYECEDDCQGSAGTEDEARATLPDTWMGGAHVRAGYSDDHLSVRLGLSGWSYYPDDGEPRRALAVFPDLEFGGGVTGKWRLLGGLGTPTIGALRNPGLYVGGDLALGAGEIQARLGVHRHGPTNSGGGRAEVIGFVPLVPRFDLRLSLAGVEHDGRGGGEGSLGLRLGF